MCILLHSYRVRYKYSYILLKVLLKKEEEGYLTTHAEGEIGPPQTAIPLVPSPSPAGLERYLHAPITNYHEIVSTKISI